MPLGHGIEGRIIFPLSLLARDWEPFHLFSPVVAGYFQGGHSYLNSLNSLNCTWIFTVLELYLKNSTFLYYVLEMFLKKIKKHLVVKSKQITHASHHIKFFMIHRNVSVENTTWAGTGTNCTWKMRHCTWKILELYLNFFVHNQWPPWIRYNPASLLFKIEVIFNIVQVLAWISIAGSTWIDQIRVKSYHWTTGP